MRVVNDQDEEKARKKLKQAVSTKKPLKQNTLKSFLLIGAIGVVALFAGYSRYNSATHGGSQILNAEKAQNVALENKIAIKKAANKKAIRNAGQSITGLDYVRQDKDDKIMNAFFNKILDWKDADEYRAARKWALKNYSIDPDSQFAKVLLPSVAQTNVGVGEKGTNEIDMNSENMHFLDMQSYVTDIRGSDYTYFAVLRVQVHDKKGAVDTERIVAMYTMDAHGRFYNAKAYTTV